MFLINPLVRSNSHTTTDVGMVTGYQEKGTVKTAGLFSVLYLDLEGRLGEEHVDGLKNIGEGAEVVMVKKCLGTGIISSVNDRCIKANPEIVDKNTALQTASIMVIADVDYMGVLIIKDLFEGL